MQKRSKYYFFSKTKTSPIKVKEDVHKNPDNKIDQDFPGYPYGQSTPGIIKPETKEQRKIAAVDIKDGEKLNDEQISDGSGGAFSQTEEVNE